MPAFTAEAETLESGVRVVTVELPAAPSVAACVLVGVGSRGETRRTQGVSHVIEHLVLQGTERRPGAVDVAEAIEAAGGALGAHTAQELTWYWSRVPSNRLELAMDVLADLVQHARLGAGDLERERGVIQQEIRLGLEVPTARIGQLLCLACFGDEPLGWPVPGTVESVRDLRHEDILAHRRAWYVASNVVVAVAGDTKHRAVVSLARRLFTSLGAGAPPAFAPAPGVSAARRAVVDSRETSHSTVGFAFPAVSRADPDRHALAVLNTLLGRGMSSRLYRELRARRGIAYALGSTVAAFRDTGLMTVVAAVDPRNVAQAAEEISRQLDGLVAARAGEEELARARDYTIGTFRLSLETPLALAYHAGELLLTTGEIDPVEEVVSRLEEVTAEDVRRVAARLLLKDVRVAALVGPGVDEARLATMVAPPSPG